MDIHLLKKEQRLESWDVEHGGGGLGEKGGGASYERGGWDRKFLMIYWGGDQNFSISHQENCIDMNLQLLLQFQSFFFSNKNFHKNNYPISDYFRSNLTAKRLSKNKSREKTLGVSCPKRESERERNIFIDLPVE